VKSDHDGDGDADDGLGQSNSNPPARWWRWASLELAMLRPDVDQRSIFSLPSTPNTLFSSHDGWSFLCFFIYQIENSIS